MSRAALVIVPMLIVIVVAIGLRVGAGEGIRAAVVYGAPTAGDALAWQVATFRDYGASRETIPVKMHVAVKAGGKTLSVAAESNEDGVAEISIPTTEHPSEIEVRADDGEVLAWGTVRWQDEPWHNDDGPGWLKATTQSGAIGIHVAPWGGRLTAGFAGTVTVSVDGAPASEIDLEAIGEEGLSIERPPPKLCARGVTTLDVLPLMQASGLRLKAKTKGGRSGEWFGPLPIALGGMQLGSVDTESHTSITAPGEAARAYVEINDDRGRRFATILPLAGDTTDPRPHAMLDFPQMPAGYYWIVVSPEPRGAETLGSSTMARRAHIGPGQLDFCDAAEHLAWTPRGFPRWVALDGLSGRRAILGKRRANGRTIALSAIASGGLLELLLILRASREAKRGLDHLESIAPRTRRRFGPLEIGIGIAIAMLGFAMLAAVVAWLT
jgi:hypothetical protein